MKIAVVGSINIDILYKVDRAPKRGESLFGNAYEILHGGKGANQAVILNSLEEEVVFLGAVGDDDFGKSAEKNLESKELEARVLHKEGNSGLAIIQLANQDNSITIFKGANDQVCKEDIDAFFLSNLDIELLVIQLEINLDTTFYMIKRANELGIKVILNPAPAYELTQNIIDQVTYIIPNETEAEELFKTDDLKQIVKMYEGKVLITMGDKGVLYYDKEVKLEPAKKLDVVDTTGAGDSFVAGFSSGISRDMTLQRAIQRGIETASITCMVLGAQTGYKNIKKLK